MELNEEQFLQRSPIWDDLLVILRKRMWLIALVFVGTVLGTYVTVQLLTERFESKASLLVKLGRENAEIPATVQNGGFFSSGIRREEINSEVEMLRSRKLVESVVDELGPESFRFEPERPTGFFKAAKYYVKKTVRWAKGVGSSFLVLMNLREELSDHEFAVLTIEEALSVAVEKDSDVITARLRLPDPAVSAGVLDLLIQHYMDAHVSVRRSENVRAFFDDQVLHLEEELDFIDKAKEAVLAEWGLANVAEQRSLLLQRLSDAERQIDNNSAERAMLLRRKNAMEARLADLPEQSRLNEVRIRNPSRETIKTRITELKLEREQMFNRYQADAVPILNLNEEIRGLEALLKQEAETHFDSVTTETHPVRREFAEKIEELTVEIAGLDASTVKLDSMVAGLRKTLDRLAAGEDRLDDILRQRQVAEQSYYAYAERMADARISEELDHLGMANIAVLSPPSVPIKPVYPRKLLITILSFPVGLFFGIGLALVLEYFNENIETKKDLLGIDGVDYLGSFRLSPNSSS